MRQLLVMLIVNKVIMQYFMILLIQIVFYNHYKMK